MIVVVDSREQKPLDFKGIEGVEKVETIGLPYGDYTGIVAGQSCPIVFERKSIGDLFGTMTSGYERFRREIYRAKEANMTLIILVEGTYTDVWGGFEHSKFDGPSMHKKLATLLVKYDVATWFCESRRVMARRIIDTFAAVERNWKEVAEVSKSEAA